MIVLLKAQNKFSLEKLLLVQNSRSKHESFVLVKKYFEEKHISF